MEKVITQRIDTFNAGITNDPRETTKGVSQMITNFDAFTDPRRLLPFRDSESGDSAASTSQKQSFVIALRTGTTYSLYALGVKSGAATAEVLYKDITTGASNDLDDATWSTPSNNQSSSGAVNFNLFVYYQKTGLIYGARAGSHIWAFSPTGSAWADSHQALAYTNIAQGIVHSKDDILYVPYDNKIATNNNGSWDATALTLPSYLYITSICEYGNYLAIACAPLSGIGKSVVFLWDRDSTAATLSERIDWGEGIIKILEELNGELVGISLAGGDSTRIKHRVIIRRYPHLDLHPREFLSTTSPVIPIAKQKIDNRLYFLMSATLHGAVRTGLWSVAKRPDGELALSHERTHNNDTAIGSGALKGFYILGDYAFISYTNTSGTYELSKTNDQESYTATSIYESIKLNGGDSSVLKSLLEATVTFEPLPSSAQIVIKYRTDEDSSWTTIATETTDNALSHRTLLVEGTGNFDDFYEMQLRIESTGGAVPTSLFVAMRSLDPRDD